MEGFRRSTHWLRPQAPQLQWLWRAGKKRKRQENEKQGRRTTPLSVTSWSSCSKLGLLVKWACVKFYTITVLHSRQMSVCILWYWEAKASIIRSGKGVPDIFLKTRSWSPSLKRNWERWRSGKILGGPGSPHIGQGMPESHSTTWASVS